MKKIQLCLIGLILVLGITQIAVTNPEVNTTYDPMADVDRDGRVDVDDLYRVGQAYGSTGNVTQYLSIPYTAFTYGYGPYPIDGPCPYRDNEILLPTVSSVCIFEAPVYLPNGANITKITFFFKFVEGANAEFGIERYNLTRGAYDYMGWISVPEPTGEKSVISTTEISFVIVDNSQFAYSVYASLYVTTIGGLGLRGCIIEYTP